MSGSGFGFCVWMLLASRSQWSRIAAKSRARAGTGIPNVPLHVTMASDLSTLEEAEEFAAKLPRSIPQLKVTGLPYTSTLINSMWPEGFHALEIPVRGHPDLPDGAHVSVAYRVGGVRFSRQDRVELCRERPFPPIEDVTIALVDARDPDPERWVKIIPDK